ncbi:MAG: diaminopimelate epimerase [Succinivibrio sp.]|nr:diaminopimelate epimerase [Succinivibrio sp.]
MHFTKMQGCGNDYVYIDGRQYPKGDRSRLAVLLSDRHFGMGSDGLIFINESAKGDFAMEMYNADGSQAQMCGNGIRCVGKFVYDHHLTDKTELKIETLAGLKELKLQVEGGRVSSATVMMGEPELSPALIPSAIPDFHEDKVLNYPLSILGRTYPVTLVSMGNPHAVIFTKEDVTQLKLEEIGPLFENHEYFPQRINTEFIQILDRSHVKMRVWERGSGETWACGTGACASCVAGALLGVTEPQLELRLKGGVLRVNYERSSNRVYLTGPCRTVYEGVLDDADLALAKADAFEYTM